MIKHSIDLPNRPLREDEITTICMLCKKVLKPGGPYISHGLCDYCLEHYDEIVEAREKEKEMNKKFDKLTHLRRAIRVLNNAILNTRHTVA